MKVLFIGGTGLISTACTELGLERGIELVHLNRGLRAETPKGVRSIAADIRDPEAAAKEIAGEKFDSVVNWIAFTLPQVEQDIGMFRDRCGQYIFISSASAYAKSADASPITEETPLINPYWEYSRNKAACEKRLLEERRKSGFPSVIVRPSHTYGPTLIPAALSDRGGPYTIVDRLKKGKPLIVPGDGNTLWTLTHNTDFALGFTGLLGRGDTLGEAFHITSDEALTWNRIHETVAEAVGAEPKLAHISTDFLIAHRPELEGTLLGDKSHNAVFDNSKIKRFVPSFKAKVPFREGVRRTLAYLEENPEQMVADQETSALWDKIIAAHEGGMPAPKT